MIILLKSTWTYFSAGSDDNGNPTDSVYEHAYFEFDTDTRTVTAYAPHETSPGPPPDFSRDPAVEFHVWVVGATRTGYFHDGLGGFTTVVTTLVITPQPVNAGCFGTNTGSIVLQLTGMAGPFSYVWDDGPTTPGRGPVRAGTYRVLVTDVPSGAQARATVQVGEQPELAVVVQAVGADVALQVSGGSGVYTYAWSDGVTTRAQREAAQGL